MLRTIHSRPGSTRLLSLAVCFTALAAAPAAQAEIVSKQPGPSGLPFPSSLADASTDGRYVLLNVGDGFSPPPGTGPEVDRDDIGAVVIRDRTADTLVELEVRVTPGGAPIAEFGALGISDDGDRVLIRSSDPAVTAFTGGTEFAVYDRSEDRLLKVPTVPGTLGGYDPILSSDGTRVLLRVGKPGSTIGEFTLWRGPVGGAASVVLDLPNLGIEIDASADLNTVVYRRTLQTATRPAANFDQVNELRARAIGVRVGTQPPRIVAEETREESLTGEACGPYGQGIFAPESGVGDVYASSDGSRIGWNQWANDGWQVAVRPAAGPVSIVPNPDSPGVPRVIAFGNATQSIWDGAPGAWADFQKELVKGDTELIGSQQSRYATPEQQLAERYVTAEPFAQTPAPPAKPITFTTEPVDTASRVSKAVWATCPDDPSAPVGAFTDYVDAQVVGRGASTRYSAGKLTVRTLPSTAVRKATKVTADLTFFGLSYWKRTLTGGSHELTLPKPLWAIPMTLKITVQPAAAPGGSAPAPLVKSYSIYATRTN